MTFKISSPSLKMMNLFFLLSVGLLWSRNMWDIFEHRFECLENFIEQICVFGLARIFIKWNQNNSHFIVHINCWLVCIGIFRRDCSLLAYWRIETTKKRFISVLVCFLWVFFLSGIWIDWFQWSVHFETNYINKFVYFINTN